MSEPKLGSYRDYEDNLSSPFIARAAFHSSEGIGYAYLELPGPSSKKERLAALRLDEGIFRKATWARGEDLLTKDPELFPQDRDQFSILAAVHLSSIRTLPSVPDITHAAAPTDDGDEPELAGTVSGYITGAPQGTLIITYLRCKELQPLLAKLHPLYSRRLETICSGGPFADEAHARRRQLKDWPDTKGLTPGYVEAPRQARSFHDTHLYLAKADFSSVIRGMNIEVNVWYLGLTVPQGQAPPKISDCTGLSWFPEDDQLFDNQAWAIHDFDFSALDRVGTVVSRSTHGMLHIGRLADIPKAEFEPRQTRWLRELLSAVEEGNNIQPGYFGAEGCTWQGNKISFRERDI